MSDAPRIERFGDRAEWDAFVERVPGGHVFLTSWWHEAWGVEPELHALRGRSGDLLAGLALVRGRWLGGDAVRRAPYTPYNHPLVDTATIVEPARQHAALGAVLDHFPRFRSLDFSIPFDTPLLGMPYLQRGFETQLGISYVIRAAKGKGWSADMTTRHRKNVKQAWKEIEKAGWSLAGDGRGEELWPLLTVTAEDKGYGLALDGARFAKAVVALQARGAAEVWIARDAKGEPLAGTLLGRGMRCGHYLAGGLRHDLRRNSNVNYALLQAMIDATVAAGLDFDFEGSSLPGIDMFFRGFGGEVCYVMRQIRMQPALLHAAASTARRLGRRKRGVSSGSPE